jgi:Trypsin
MNKSISTFSVIVLFATITLTASIRLCAGEIIISPNIDPNSYISIGNQARFDTVVAEVAFPIIQGKRGKPVAGCTGTMLSSNIILTAAHCVLDTKTVETELILNSGTKPSYIGGKPFDIRFVLGADQNGTQLLRVTNIKIHEKYSAATETGVDLAILKFEDDKTGRPVTTFVRNGVPEKLIFIKLYSGMKEFVQPFPNIGNSVGYGNFGNGLTGEITGSSGTKRAGLILVEESSLFADLLSSTFYDLSSLYELGLPNNFLEIGPACGDSGGPLIQYIGTAGAPVETGVAKKIFSVSWQEAVWLLFEGKRNRCGSKHKYGTLEYWTRVGKYISWIQGAVSEVGGSIQAPDPGG